MMNKIALILAALMLLLCGAAFAADGDLIVNGMVGIGTTTPGIYQNVSGRSYLTIKGASEAGVLELASGAVDSDVAKVGQVTWADINSIGTDKRAAIIQVTLQGTTANNRGGRIGFFTKADNGSTVQRMVIDNVGNVGIGNAAPQVKLDVAGGVKIGVVADTCTAIIAGTLRYNNGSMELCNGTAWSPMGNNVLWDFTVTSAAVTSVTSPSLNIVADGGSYDFECVIVNDGPDAKDYRLFYNNDLADSSYNRTRILGSTGTSGETAADAKFLPNKSAGTVRMVGVITLTPNGLIITTMNEYRNGSTMTIVGHRKVAAESNLTRLDIISSVAGGIGINSRFRIMKRR